MAYRTRGPIARPRNSRFGGGANGSQFAGTAQVSLAGLDEIEKQFAGPRLEEIVKKVGQKVLDLAQSYAPVRTGELRDSGYVQTENNGSSAKVEVGFSANHAAPVEFGAQGRAPKPFLRTAWDEVVGSGDAKREMAQGAADLLSEIGE